MTSKTTLIQGGQILGEQGKAQPADIRIESGRISAISPAGLVPHDHDEIINAHQQLIMPGLINAHAHSTLSMTKGTTDRMNHPTFMWTNQCDTAWRSAEQIEAVTTLAAADMLRNGITSVIDHVPEQNATLENVAPIARAWRQSGVRVAMALRIFDGSYDDIGEPPMQLPNNPLQPQPAEDLLGMCAEAIGRWHRQAEGMQVFVGPSNSERCSDELLAGCHDLAIRHGTGFHAHLLETKVQRESCLAGTGLTPVGRLKSLGALSERCSFAHCVWVDEDDMHLMAQTGAVAIHNPHSNAKLGVGLMPLPAMLNAGCVVALGTDGASTNDTLNMHECMALALLLQRPGGLSPAQWTGAQTAIEMATQNGAKAMLQHGELGGLAEGAWADLAFYDLTSLDLYPAHDLAQQYVFAERGRSLKQTMVAGEILYCDGQFSSIDLAAARETLA